MTFEAGRIEISQVNDNKIQKVVIERNDTSQSVRNDTEINVPREAFIPGTPLPTNNNWTGVSSYCPYCNNNHGNIQIQEGQLPNGVKVKQINGFPPGYSITQFTNLPNHPNTGIIIIQNNNTVNPSATPQTQTAQPKKFYDKNLVDSQIAALKKASPSGDGKFSFGELFKNIGVGVWEEIKGIGKALTTPLGLLTAVGVGALCIAFPPVGVAVAGVALAYGVGKTLYSGYKVASEYAKGNYDQAELEGKGIGAGLFDSALAAIGLRGSLNAMKAAKAGGASGAAANGSKTPPPSGPSGNPNIAGELPPPSGTTTGTTGASSTTSGASTAANTKALPPPSGTTTGASGTTSGASTTANTASNTANTAANAASKTSFFHRAVNSIDDAENINFVESVAGRYTSQTVKNPYKVLGLDPKNFSQSQLTQAYRKLAMNFHPDRNPGVSTEYFQHINRAHSILADAAKRQSINQALGL